jgi:hypothetical protein
LEYKVYLLSLSKSSLLLSLYRRVFILVWEESDFENEMDF